MKSKFSAVKSPQISRRRFVQGLSVGGAVAGLGLWRTASWAESKAESPGILRGTDFELDLGATPVNFTGTARLATAVNGQVPAPALYWREGDTVTLRVTNHLPTTSSLHWHGILLPAAMDGVPGLSFHGIAPGETFVYRFDVRHSGTWARCRAARRRRMRAIRMLMLKG